MHCALAIYRCVHNFLVWTTLNSHLADDTGVTRLEASVGIWRKDDQPTEKSTDMPFLATSDVEDEMVEGL